MYCTIADLTNRLHPDELLTLADDNNDGIADTDLLQAAIDEASSEVDVFLAARYALPFSSPPDVLTPLCVIIAVHRLYLRRRLAISPELAEVYAGAIDMLVKISRGELGLGLSFASAQKPVSTSSNDDKTFSTDALRKY